MFSFGVLTFLCFRVVCFSKIRGVGSFFFYKVGRGSLCRGREEGRVRLIFGRFFDCRFFKAFF